MSTLPEIVYAHTKVSLGLFRPHLVSSVATDCLIVVEFFTFQDKTLSS